MMAEADSSSRPPGEERIIAEFFAPLSHGWPGAHGLGDDCATISPAPGQDLVVKTDPIRAGVHFFPDDKPQDIAWKALAVNVSDLAAKAARPLAYMLAMSFPSAPNDDWLAAFVEGLSRAQDEFGCVLIGGDTDHAPGPLSLAVTVFGEVPIGRMVQRGTPAIGDLIFVTGTLGDAALGLAVRNEQLADYPKDKRSDQFCMDLLDRYLRPRPRIGLRAALRAYATAAMDLSDGLGKDLGRMCRVSGFGAIVEESKIPLSEAFCAVAPAANDARRALISSGDDYEILCTVSPENADAFAALAAAGGTPVTLVGEMKSATGVKLIDLSGNACDWAAQGYDHFG